MYSQRCVVRVARSMFSLGLVGPYLDVKNKLIKYFIYLYGRAQILFHLINLGFNLSTARLADRKLNYSVWHTGKGLQ